MEENNNTEVVNVETTPVAEESPVVTEVVEQAVPETAPIVEEQTVVVADSPTEENVSNSNPEFVTADQIGGTPLEDVAAPKKKKVNKTLIIVLIFAVVFGGVMLLMTLGDKGGYNYGDEQQEEEEKIKVNTGTEWGDKYLTYLMTEKKDLKTYEITFINVDDSETPEMFVKYIDNSDLESMKIFYIADDGFVYETKYYRDYRIRYIYSLKDKTIDWYLYLTTTKNYGSYTVISKILDNMAFDADIKATNDALLIEYGKRYYDTDYQPVFYTIRENHHEEDFKDFVAKYKGYNDKVEELKAQVIEKYKDYEYKEEVKETNDSIGLAGRIFKYGSYYANIPADLSDDGMEHTKVITLYEDGKIAVDGILYTYTVDYEHSTISLGTFDIRLLDGKFDYKGNIYQHFSTR